MLHILFPAVVTRRIQIIDIYINNQLLLATYSCTNHQTHTIQRKISNQQIIFPLLFFILQLPARVLSGDPYGDGSPKEREDRHIQTNLYKATLLRGKKLNSPTLTHSQKVSSRKIMSYNNFHNNEKVRIISI